MFFEVEPADTCSTLLHVAKFSSTGYPNYTDEDCKAYSCRAVLVFSVCIKFYFKVVPGYFEVHESTFWTLYMYGCTMWYEYLVVFPVNYEYLKVLSPNALFLCTPISLRIPMSLLSDNKKSQSGSQVQLYFKVHVLQSTLPVLN